MTAEDLPAIPVIDARSGGPLAVARAADARMRELLRDARRKFTPPVLAVLDRVSRSWLERTDNPYRDEISEIAEILGKSGAHALNASYEWTCTSGVGKDPQGGVRLLRVLDWRQAGLGRNLVIAWQRGPAGDFANITWPGYVGVVTAAAPGRFAVAINQPPMASWGATFPIDWAIGRAKVWRSHALPPSHLLRRVCETCPSYESAKRLLSKTPLCLPAFFILAGAEDGEGCVIERSPSGVAVRNMPAAVANHWVALPQRGPARGRHSQTRLAQMDSAVADGTEVWLVPPIANRHTRLVAEINLRARRLIVQGWERKGPATEELVLHIPAFFRGASC